MFYSYDILNVRKGKLSVAWLAATGRFKFTNKKDKHFREIMGSVIYKLCDDIISYVGPVQDTTRTSKRFSLYLSSMLMCGTARVYKFQVKFLLDSVTEAYTHIFSHSKIQEIGLDATVIPRGMKTVIDFTAQESFFFGDPRLDLELDSAFPGSKSVDLKTPRRRVPRKEGEDQETDGVIQISEITRVEDDGEVAQLLQDWPDISLYPNVAADIRAITMIEDPLLRPSLFPEQVPELASVFQELDFGPSFLIPPDDFLKTKEPQNEDYAEKDREMGAEIEKEQRPPAVATSQADDLDTIVAAPLPDLQETPIQPVARPVEPLFPKKDKLKSVSEGETPASDALKPARKEDEIQIVLSEIENAMQQQPKRQRKKRKLVFMDIDEIHISKAQIQDQLNNCADTMREKTSNADMIKAHWWKVMKGSEDLLFRSQRRPISSKLNKLITRNYVSNPENGFYDNEVSAKRQLRLDDISIDKEQRRKSSDKSSIIQLSMVSGVDKTLSAEKSHGTSRLTLLETPAIVPAQPDATPLLPIEEEQVDPTRHREKGFEHVETPSQGFDLPHGIKPTVLFPPLDEKKRKAVTRKRPERDDGTSPPKRKKASVTEIFEDQDKLQEILEDQYKLPEIPEDQDKLPEIPEYQDKLPDIPEDKQLSAYEILKKREERMGNLSSSGEGFQVVTVTAEVHVQEPPRIQIEEELPFEEPSLAQPAGPHPPIGELASINLSPVSRHGTFPVIMTPDAEKQQRELNILQRLRTKQDFIFDSLLPVGATRRDVATTFAYLLNMHKKKRVKLSQKEPYGTIKVKVTKKRLEF